MVPQFRYDKTDAWQRAVSLFELLVVVSVIFILVVILLFSFSHLLISTKITRVREEQNILIRGLTNYHLDYGAFPPTFLGLAALSAPTAYLGSIPIDPFSKPNSPQRYFYLGHPGNGIDFLIISVGPDGDNDFLQVLNNYLAAHTNVTAASLEYAPLVSYYLETKVYDPTNGIRSEGDVVYIRKK